MQNYTVSSRGMMGVSLCEANQGTSERVFCPSEQGPSVWLRTRACPDARSSGKLVAIDGLSGSARFGRRNGGKRSSLQALNAVC